jgi:hypothetical protein
VNSFASALIVFIGGGVGMQSIDLIGLSLSAQLTGSYANPVTFQLNQPAIAVSATDTVT